MATARQTPHSELPRSQRDSEGGSTLPWCTLIFWVQCQQVLYYYYSSAFFFSKTLCRFIDWSSSSIYIQVRIITLEGEKPVENKRGKTGSPAINGLQVRSCIGVATCSLLHWKVFFSINNLGRTMSSLDYLKQKKKREEACYGPIGCVALALSSIYR